MTRTKHYAHATPQFPISCLDFISDGVLALGGGGGASRSGLANKLRLCKVSSDGVSMTDMDEFVFEKGEDAPTSMAIDQERKLLVAGVNETESSIKSGRNKHCRVFSFADDKLVASKSKQTIEAQWQDLDYPYQKITSLNPTASLLAIGTTDNKVVILTWPGMEVISDGVKDQEVENELIDLDWSHDGFWLSVTSNSATALYSISTPASATLGESEKNVLPTIKFRQKIYPPSLDIVPADFRACRFSPTQTPGHKLRLYAILNATKPKPTAGKRRTKSSGRDNTRKAWAVTFGVVADPSKNALTAEEKGKGREKDEEVEAEVGKWDVVSRREIGGKPVTTFDVSPDGRLLAYASSDLSIGVLEAKTLAPMLKILHAHSFAITALKFSPSGSLLASAGADNTVRLIVVPSSFGGLSMPVLAFLIALLLVIVGVLLQRHGLHF